MRHVAMAALALLLLVAAGAGAQDEGERRREKTKYCDMKKQEDGFYCKDCWKLVPSLEEHAKEEATKAHKPVKVKICVKRFFRCEKCNKDNAAAGKCHELDRKEIVDKGRIFPRCELCGAESEKAGSCKAEGCKKQNAKIRLMCEMSGNYPHGGEPPK